MDNFNINSYKGVIFDLDGVIFDVVGPIKQALQDALDKYQINTDVNQALEEIAHLLEELQNYPIPKIILKSYDFLQLKLFEGISYLKKLRIAVYIFNQFNKNKETAVIFEGIPEIVSKLCVKNIKLAILTNNKNTYAEDVLKKFNLNSFFELIIGFNEVEGKVKPNPDGILKILDQWKVKPSEVVFIGDMVTDILAGKAANVKTICVATGLALKDALMNQNPEILLNNILELRDILNK